MNISSLIGFVREIYKTNDFIPLHAPTFSGNEKSYVSETIDSTFVSSVGKFVDDFEHRIENFTHATKAVSTVNGTAALTVALHLSDVQRGDLVITQPLTFVATCNALYHLGAQPVFIDVSPISLGLSPKALAAYLDEYAEVGNVGCIHKKTRQRIKAVVPMHTFGHPVEMDELLVLCQHWQLDLIEDAAESLGSFYKGKHTGTLGKLGILSFNGNKIITTGGGGMILCQTEELGKYAKHITTTAKIPHPYEFFHDEPAFNYRMPNINAALGCAQIENLETYIKQKRQLAEYYQRFFINSDCLFVKEPDYAHSNYWLNAIICHDAELCQEILKETNQNGVMTRPVWQLMHYLPMYSQSLRGDLSYAEWVAKRLINLPSTPIEIA